MVLSWTTVKWILIHLYYPPCLVRSIDKMTNVLHLPGYCKIFSSNLPSVTLVETGQTWWNPVLWPDTPPLHPPHWTHSLHSHWKNLESNNILLSKAWKTLLQIKLVKFNMVIVKILQLVQNTKKIIFKNMQSYFSNWNIRPLIISLTFLTRLIAYGYDQNVCLIMLIIVMA